MEIGISVAMRLLMQQVRNLAPPNGQRVGVERANRERTPSGIIRFVPDEERVAGARSAQT